MDALVVTSLLGVGSYDVSSPRYIGYVGHTGHLAANRAVYECDFLLVLGSRLDVRQTGTLVDQFVPNGKIVQVNSDINELDNPRVRVDWKVNCDVASFCESFYQLFPKKSNTSDTEWIDSIKQIKSSDLEDLYSSSSLFVQPKQVLHSLASKINNSPLLSLLVLAVINIGLLVISFTLSVASYLLLLVMEPWDMIYPHLSVLHWHNPIALLYVSWAMVHSS